jgi:hypothetical protein
MKGVYKKRKFYWNTSCAHQKNATLYVVRGERSVLLLQTNQNFKRKKARKNVQFATVFHILPEGRPMTEYESMQKIFTILEVPRCPNKHWGDNNDWNMADVMKKIIFLKVVEYVEGANYFAVTYDEGTTNDNQSMLYIQIYMS